METLTPMMVVVHLVLSKPVTTALVVHHHPQIHVPQCAETDTLDYLKLVMITELLVEMGKFLYKLKLL